MTERRIFALECQRGDYRHKGPPWPQYPRWKAAGIPKPNRSRRARGKARLRFHPLYRKDTP